MTETPQPSAPPAVHLRVRRSPGRLVAGLLAFTLSALAITFIPTPRLGQLVAAIATVGFFAGLALSALGLIALSVRAAIDLLDDWRDERAHYRRLISAPVAPATSPAGDATRKED